MRGIISDTRWKAALAALSLLLVGAGAGIAVDRLLTGRAPAPATAAPLTLEALGEDLDLGPEQQTRLREVLDSLEREFARAAVQGPDSLRAAARDGRTRLEEVLPAERRGEFRSWMRGHHERMMNEMRRRMGRMHEGRPMMGPMMMGRDSLMGPDARVRERGSDPAG